MNLTVERQRFFAVVLLTLWCLALWVVSVVRVTEGLWVWLLWNLFLALVPLFWSSVFQLANANKRPLLACISFVLWLLFLPNAPYILTDLIHLGRRSDPPLWYQLATLLSYAGTGTFVGYLSLINIQEVIEKSYGRFAGWALAVFALMASGFGIYVGRFLRWNSWNALNSPLKLVQDVLSRFSDPGPHPHPIPVTLVFGVGLIIGYLALRVIAIPASPRLAPTRK